MNILLYRYNSICEDAVIRGLKELGHNVCQVTLEIVCKAPTGSEIFKQVVETIEDNNIDIIFSINYYPVLSEIAKLYNLLYFSWIVDAPVLELYSKTIKNRCNRVFIFDSELYKEILEYNPYNIFYLPLAADCEFYQCAIKNASDYDVERFTHNISFVGSLYTEKCPYDNIKNVSVKTEGYLNGIMRAQEKVYGYYFIEELLSDDIVQEVKKNNKNFYQALQEDFITDKRILSQLYIGNKITCMERIDTFKEISKYYSVDIYTASDTTALPDLKKHGIIMTHTQMPIVFNNSIINLNPTSKPIRNGIPLRVFDILSCEGFVLSNYQRDLFEYFTPGQDLDIYSSIDELKAKIEYYMSHKAICKEIAHSGYENVLKHHTYAIRLQEMFDLAYHKRKKFDKGERKYV